MDMSNHKHHIVPTYKCKELGLTTSYKIDGREFYFKENMVEVTREQHALIHWGYWCNDLSPLLEICNPPQWVIDMIPLEDVRDSGAAGVIALGEIEQIDMSGENHPNFKTGMYVGVHKDPKIMALATKKWIETLTPEQNAARLENMRVKSRVRRANRTPEEKEEDNRKQRIKSLTYYYNLTPEEKEERKRKDRVRQKEYRTNPETRPIWLARRKRYRDKKKLKKLERQQGQGTLEDFISE